MHAGFLHLQGFAGKGWGGGGVLGEGGWGVNSVRSEASLVLHPINKAVQL